MFDVAEQPCDSPVEIVVQETERRPAQVSRVTDAGGNTISRKLKENGMQIDEYVKGHRIPHLDGNDPKEINQVTRVVQGKEHHHAHDRARGTDRRDGSPGVPIDGKVGERRNDRGQ